MPDDGQPRICSKDKCENAAVPLNYGFCAEHRKGKKKDQSPGVCKETGCSAPAAPRNKGRCTKHHNENYKLWYNLTYMEQRNRLNDQMVQYLDDSVGKERGNPKTVLAELRATQFKAGNSRLNTRLEADHRPTGMCVGAIKSYRKGVALSSHTQDHPHLTRLCCDLIRKAYPDFTFTSVQINKNYASALHVDNGNLGPSYIYGLGEYGQGALYIHKKGEINVKGKWQKFDGNIPHLTCPFTGERFTLIYFTNQSYELVPDKEVEHLKKFGFNWPKPGLVKAKYEKKEDRLKQAREALPPHLTKCAGEEYKGKPVSGGLRNLAKVDPEKRAAIRAKQKKAQEETRKRLAKIRGEEYIPPEERRPGRKAKNPGKAKAKKSKKRPRAVAEGEKKPRAAAAAAAGDGERQQERDWWAQPAVKRARVQMP